MTKPPEKPPNRITDISVLLLHVFPRDYLGLPCLSASLMLLILLTWYVSVTTVRDWIGPHLPNSFFTDFRQKLSSKGPA